MSEYLGGLKIIEHGAKEISKSSHGQSTAYFYTKDKDNNYYIFVADIGNAGISFKIYPYNERQNSPKIKDLKWCKTWCVNYVKNIGTDEYQKTNLILSIADYNKISSMLGYNTIAINNCGLCNSKNIDTFWYANGFCCFECVNKLKVKYSYKY